MRKLAKHLILKIKLENEKNIDFKTGKKIFLKIKDELNFVNKDKMEEVEAIKGLLKTETKVDKLLVSLVSLPIITYF